MISRKSTILLFVILIFGLVEMCAAGSTLIFGMALDVDQLDPGDTNINQVVSNIFEGLVRFKEGTTDIEPCLATSWEISENGKEITFQLRRDITFHDGTDFNADAVIFSFARQYDPNHPYHQYGNWTMWEYLFHDIERIEKIDDYRVKFFLKKPNVSILTSLAHHRVSIVSPANARKYQEDAFKQPCGTGPFKFVEWVKNGHVTLEVNTGYWQEKASLDTLIFKVIPDPSVRLLALEIGEIHGMEYPNPVDLERIKTNKELKLMSRPGFNVGFLAINTGYGYVDKNKNGIRDINSENIVKTPGYFEPLTKKNVRKAINMAIDKQAIVNNLYMGAAIKAKNGMPPFMLGYNDDIDDYPYDPKRAKALLIESGYPDGFELALHVMPVPRPYMLDPLKVAEAIQSYLDVIGIKVNIYQIDWSNYLKETRDGKHQICQLGWIGDNGDPDNFMNVYNSNRASIGMAQNRAFYMNDRIDKLLYLALTTYNNQQRAKYYKEIQEIIHEDAAWVYLFHSTQNVVFKKNIKGFVLNPLNMLFFYPVYIE